MVTTGEILSYAQDCGPDAAKDLLELFGPDCFDGDYDEYSRAFGLIDLFCAADD